MPANSSIIKTMTILQIQVTQDGILELYCNACSFFLVIHSRTSIIATNSNVFFVPTYKNGISNKLPLKNPHTYSQTIPMLSALKIIHPNTAKKKVKSIWPVSFTVGKNLPSATWLVYLRFLPVRISGRKSKA